jgi:hypothetical protein
MQIKLPTSDLKAALTTALTGALSTEQQLAADAQAQVRKLIDDLYPLLTEEVQAMLTGKQPAVAQAYLAILQGVVDATIAKLGLRALQSQRAILASALQTAVQILAMVLRAAVVV